MCTFLSSTILIKRKKIKNEERKCGSTGVDERIK